MRYLVTGANRGIGLEVSKQLLALGHEVVLTARNAETGQAAASDLGCDFHQLDVTDMDSIQVLASSIADKYGTVDGLIQNAGIIPHGEKDVLRIDPEEVERALRTNAIGPLYIAQALHDLIAPGGHMVMVSSGAGEVCGPISNYAPIYSSSKTLLNALSRRIARALADKPVYVHCVCPGWVATDMGGADAPRSVEEGAETIVWLATGGAGKETGNFYRDKTVIDW